MDRTTKALLALIAGGLWANAVGPHIAGQASAQSHPQGDVCLTAGECLQSINGWISDSDRHLQGHCQRPPLADCHHAGFRVSQELAAAAGARSFACTGKAAGACPAGQSRQPASQ
jgi:hypothetical protein